MEAGFFLIGLAILILALNAESLIKAFRCKDKSKGGNK